MSTGPANRARRALFAVMAASMVGLVGACARQGAPPGGPQDRRPPVVVLTVPDTFAVDSAFRGTVRFDFNERISERPTTGTLDGAVVVSPRTGDVRVSHSRAGIEVELAGGFKRGLVYRVTLLPVFKDMFNNQMHDPFELVFSTGAPFVRSAVAGLIWDETTGDPQKDWSVLAQSDADSSRYFAQSDTAGIYTFRYLPPARYRLTAFEDRNQNHLLDPTEARGTRAVLLNGPDTILPLDIHTLRPDTSHARVRAVDVLDSLTVVVSFDHYLAQDVPSTQMSASLSMGDSTPGAPGVVRLFKEHEYSEWVEQVRDSVARLDSIAAAEKARASTAQRAAQGPTRPGGPPRDTGAVRDTTTRQTPPKPYLPPRLQGGGVGGPAGTGPAGGRQAGIGPDGNPLPKQRIVLVLDSALVPNQDYLVEVRGVTTVNGVPLGGGQAHFTRPPPKDTTRVVGDSATAKDTAVVKDTSVVRDTAVVPDTARGAVPMSWARGAPKRTSRDRLPFPFAALPGKGGGR